MIFGTCKLHTTRSGVMQILSKFYHNKHLIREMAPRRINMTDAYSLQTTLNACNSFKRFQVPIQLVVLKSVRCQFAAQFPEDSCACHIPRASS